jgi:hypothetical protein
MNWKELETAIETGDKVKALAMIRPFVFGDAIAIEWDVSDVNECAEYFDLPTPSTKQAREVLNYCSLKHDANFGITWEVVAEYLCEVVTKGGIQC